MSSCAEVSVGSEALGSPGEGVCVGVDGVPAACMQQSTVGTGSGLNGAEGACFCCYKAVHNRP